GDYSRIEPDPRGLPGGRWRGVFNHRRAGWRAAAARRSDRLPDVGLRDPPGPSAADDVLRRAARQAEMGRTLTSQTASLTKRAVRPVGWTPWSAACPRAGLCGLRREAVHGPLTLNERGCERTNLAV